MNLVTVYDTGSSGPPNYAYNLYQCEKCGTLCKEDVWEGRGKIWIKNDNDIEREIR